MQRLPTATIRCICRLHHSAVVPSACCVSAPQHRTAERLFVRLFVRRFFRLLVVVVGLSWKGPLESLWDVWSFSIFFLFCRTSGWGACHFEFTAAGLNATIWCSCCQLRPSQGSSNFQALFKVLATLRWSPAGYPQRAYNLPERVTYVQSRVQQVRTGWQRQNSISRPLWHVLSAIFNRLAVTCEESKAAKRAPVLPHIWRSLAFICAQLLDPGSAGFYQEWI